MTLSLRSQAVRNAGWRFAYRVSFPLARTWWRLRQQPHEGALVAVYAGSCLLLLRCSYRREWNLPGGGINPGETPEQAARRELKEEIALAPDELVLAHVVSGIWDGRPDQVHVYEMRVSRLPSLTLDNREIVEARLFSTSELQDLSVTGPTMAYLMKAGLLMTADKSSGPRQDGISTSAIPSRRGITMTP